MASLTLGISNFSATPNTDGWANLLGTARDADIAGIDRLVVVDHVVMGSDTSAYDGPRFPTGPEGEWLEPLTVLSVIAGQTERVRLSTGILIAALRRPAVLAKTLATLDVLSGGRVDLGVGVGWQRKEYEAVGLDFDRRGALLDASLLRLRELWAASPTTDDVWCEPKPLQPGGVPVWVSGRLNPAVLRRIVSFGDGWIPWGEFAADVAASVPIVHEVLRSAGRDPRRFQIRAPLSVVRDAGGTLDLSAMFAPVAELVASGVTDFGVNLPLPSGSAGAAGDGVGRSAGGERLELLSAVVKEFRASHDHGSAHDG